MEALYEIIKAKKRVSDREENGSYKENKDGFIATKEEDIFYIKRNGKFLRDSGNILGVLIASLVIGGFSSIMITAIITGGYDNQIFISITLVISIIVSVLFYKSKDSLDHMNVYR